MKVIVKSKTVTFRRKDYAPGDKIDVPDQVGRNLLAAGVCEKTDEDRKEKIENSFDDDEAILAEMTKTGKGQKPDVGGQKSEVGKGQKSAVNQQSTINNRQSKGGE